MSRTRRTVWIRIGARLLGPALALLSFAPRPAAAWHDDGHRIVGEIAERQLSEHAREQVRALLADMPEYDTLATAATWADQQAREDARFEFINPNHYVNLRERVSPRELYRRCLETRGCVALGIAYYAEILRSERASKAQRAEALRFLAHFIGDVHQPLHAGLREDRGGNDIDDLGMLEFTPDKQRANLHALWDGGFVAITEAREGWDWKRYAAELDGRIDADMQRRWARGSSYDWLEESRLFAAGNGYLHADGHTPIRSGDELGEDWYALNLPVAEQRLQQGGVRLAYVLEQIFAAPW